MGLCLSRRAEGGRDGVSSHAVAPPKTLRNDAAPTPVLHQGCRRKMIRHARATFRHTDANGSYPADNSGLYWATPRAHAGHIQCAGSGSCSHSNRHGIAHGHGNAAADASRDQASTNSHSSAHHHCDGKPQRPRNEIDMPARAIRYPVTKQYSSTRQVRYKRSRWRPGSENTPNRGRCCRRRDRDPYQ